MSFKWPFCPFCLYILRWPCVQHSVDRCTSLELSENKGHRTMRPQCPIAHTELEMRSHNLSLTSNTLRHPVLEVPMKCNNAATAKRGSFCSDMDWFSQVSTEAALDKVQTTVFEWKYPTRILTLSKTWVRKYYNLCLFLSKITKVLAYECTQVSKVKVLWVIPDIV